MAAAEASSADTADIAAFLFGTGARISEALHCVSWSDVDLELGTVRVRGTKTANADRVLSLADDLSERLRQRAALHGTRGLVFGVTRYASKVGEPRDRNNVSKALRQAFAKAGVPWAGTHTFRRTVATWLDANGAALAEIANQLGHADTNVTAAYLGRTGTPTRAAQVMVLPTAARKLHAV
jgi:integrase